MQPEFLLQESSQVLLTLGKTPQLFQQQNKPLAGKATLPTIPSPAYPWRFPLVSALIQTTEDQQPPGMGAGGRSRILILPTRGEPPSQGVEGKTREAWEQEGRDFRSWDLGKADNICLTGL